MRVFNALSVFTVEQRRGRLATPTVDGIISPGIKETVRRRWPPRRYQSLRTSQTFGVTTLADTMLTIKNAHEGGIWQHHPSATPPRIKGRYTCVPAHTEARGALAALPVYPIYRERCNERGMWEANCDTAYGGTLHYSVPPISPLKI